MQGFFLPCSVYQLFLLKVLFLVVFLIRIRKDLSQLFPDIFLNKALPHFHPQFLKVVLFPSQAQGNDQQEMQQGIFFEISPQNNF